MEHFYRRILIAILCTPLAMGRTVTLKETLQIAMENAPEARTVRLNQKVRAWEESSATYRFLPRLDLTSNLGLQHNVPSAPTEPWSSQLGVSLTESLYDNGESIVKLRASKLNREIAELNQLQVRNKVTLDLTIAFYDYSLAAKLLEVKSQQLKTLQKQLELASTLHQQGMKLQVDFLRFKTGVQRAEIDQRTAATQLETSITELKRIMGYSQNTSEPIEFLRVEPTAEETQVPVTPPALDKTFEKRIAETQTRINQLNVDLVSRNVWPQLNLTTGAGYTNSSFIHSPNAFSGGQQYGWNIMLTLKYNLWDWGTQRRDAEIARANADVQDNSQQQTLLAVDASIRNLMGQLALLNTNYQWSRELLKAEEQSYSFIKQQYQEGKSQYIDLITSLNSLLDANVKLHSARFSLAQNMAKYRYYEGTLYEFIAQ